MKASSYGQRAGLMLVIAVGCRLGSMLLSTIRVEVGQPATLGHVIAVGASFALALLAIPFLVLALVYGVLHLVRGQRSTKEDAPTQSRTDARRRAQGLAPFGCDYR